MFKNFYKLRTKILKYFPFIKVIKKYKVIIPKFKSYFVWPILKPEKMFFDNKTFYLSTNKYPNPSRDLFSYRSIYSSYERNLINQFLKTNCNCLDIGANIGFFTHLFLKKTGSRGKIYSFEMIPEIFSILKKNFEQDKNVFPILGKVGINHNEIQIDNLIKDKINFIKIDLDGADFFALKSCENIIKKDHPTIIIELGETSHKYHGVHYHKTIDFLNKYNYQVFEVDKDLKPFNRDLKVNEVINIFAN